MYIDTVKICVMKHTIWSGAMCGLANLMLMGTSQEVMPEVEAAEKVMV